MSPNLQRELRDEFFFNVYGVHVRRFIHASRFTDVQTCNKKVIKTVLGKAVSNEPRPRAFHTDILNHRHCFRDFFVWSSRCCPAKELLHYEKYAPFIIDVNARSGTWSS